MNEDSTRSSSTKSSQRGGRNWFRTEEALPRPNFEPKNLLGLFEDTTVEGQPWDEAARLRETFKGNLLSL